MTCIYCDIPVGEKTTLVSDYWLCHTCRGTFHGDISPAYHDGKPHPTFHCFKADEAGIFCPKCGVKINDIAIPCRGEGGNKAVFDELCEAAVVAPIEIEMPVLEPVKDQV